MLNLEHEKQLTKILATGLFTISVLVSTAGVTDPVNVPKLLFLGTFGGAVFGYLISSKTKFWKSQQMLLASLFLVFSFVSVVKSPSPISQNLYGAYGRNNGFISYFFLAILLIGASVLNRRQSHETILKALLFVGYVNLAYCLWVIMFGDFISWNNQYGNILGTFGNPNFIGAFLGIFFGVQLAFGLGKNSSKKFKLGLFFLLPLTLFEIIDSHAIQGRVLAALATSIIFFFYARSKFRNIFVLLYSFLVVLIGAIALAGAFQKGPLTEIIYKTSVSLRGQYWLAAWNAGNSNPASGVGMDAFGDWYRRSRDFRAIELPGINTVVNAAHNVPLDMFAYGGWPLFLTYLLLIAVSLRSLIGIAKRMTGYDAVGVGLITAWTCYQVQSIISINQIGLAIWGWALSGCLIGYDQHLKNLKGHGEPIVDSSPRKTIKSKDMEAKSTLHVAIFGLIGFLVVLPPVSADVSLRTAQVSRDALKLESTMQVSYFNPLNTEKFVNNIQAYESSGLFDFSHKYALAGVNWNPESYNLWQMLFLVKNSTSTERDLAIANMKRLDPLNPDVATIK